MCGSKFQVTICLHTEKHILVSLLLIMLTGNEWWGCGGAITAGGHQALLSSTTGSQGSASIVHEGNTMLPQQRKER